MALNVPVFINTLPVIFVLGGILITSLMERETFFVFVTDNSDWKLNSDITVNSVLTFAFAPTTSTTGTCTPASASAPTLRMNPASNHLIV